MNEALNYYLDFLLIWVMISYCIKLFVVVASDREYSLLLVLIPFLEIYIILEPLINKIMTYYNELMRKRDIEESNKRFAEHERQQEMKAKEERMKWILLEALVDENPDLVYCKTESMVIGKYKIKEYSISKDLKTAKEYGLDTTVSESEIRNNEEDLKPSDGYVIKIVNLDKNL